MTERIQAVFGRSTQEIKVDWEKAVNQIKFLLDNVSAATKDYDLDEITFGLAFSAEGQLVFIAKAGVTATISATFKRRA